MKQSESNILKMVQAVLANLRKDQEFWINEPEIVAEVTEIETEYNLIEESQNTIAGLDQTGYTKSKNMAFDSIIRATYKLARKMCVYARRQKDEILLQFVDQSVNSLSAGIEKDAISRCSAILNKAELLLAELQSSKITADEIARIKQLIVVYNEHINGRSTVKTSKSVSISDNSTRIAALGDRLLNLDDMIEGYLENEEMIARYMASRIVINYGKGKTMKNKTEEVPSVDKNN
jgi:hypothetical protein